MRVVFVHGACVRDGEWWWGPTARALEARGVRSTSPGLPSCGEAGVPGGADGPGLADDVAAVRAVLAADDEPTVVVAQSYGGIVVAEAADGLDTVQRLVLVSSYLPEVGQGLSHFGEDGPAPFLDVDPAGGTFTVRPELLVDTFLHDCGPEVQQEGVSHLARQSLRVIGEVVAAASWQRLPTTYVVCAGDRGTPARLQRRYAERADAVVELATGHHPFLARPGAMAQVLLAT